MIHGIFYGILITFIIYFAVLSTRMRNTSAMWFVLYTVCVGLLLSIYQGDITGLIKPGRETLYITILLTLNGLLYFSGVKLLRTLLNINLYSKSMDRFLVAIQWMSIGFIPMNLLNNPLTLIFNITLIFIGPIISCGILISLWIRGVFSTGYFTIGWIIGHMAFQIAWLHVFGFTPWISGHPYLLPSAITCSIIIYSIAIVSQNREYRAHNHQDNLTGIASRRLFKQTLETEWKRSHRNQSPLSIIIANIDDFKSYNGTYGHAKGDACLKAVAQIFHKLLRRASDMAARYSGNEFIALLPDTNVSEAVFLAEKIREAFEMLAIKHEQSSTGKILTISLGTATLIPNAETSPANILLSADKAIYQAKINGRNRVFSKNQKNK